jgi:hypothetical protein
MCREFDSRAVDYFALGPPFFFYVFLDHKRGVEKWKGTGQVKSQNYCILTWRPRCMVLLVLCAIVLNLNS